MRERERERGREGRRWSKYVAFTYRCVDRRYSPDLPTASVVIIFHNEAYTVLLRTITSVINRSPDHLLQEIVLVDDFSDHGKAIHVYMYMYIYFKHTYAHVHLGL